MWKGDGNNLRGLACTNGLWVCVGNEGRILTSTNALGWKKRVTPTEENLHAVRSINGTFVAVGNAGAILQSDSMMPLLSAGRDAANLRLTFSSPFEGVFELQQTENFTWNDLANLTNEVGTVDYTLPLPAGDSRRFYRVISP